MSMCSIRRWFERDLSLIVTDSVILLIFMPSRVIITEQKEKRMQKKMVMVTPTRNLPGVWKSRTFVLTEDIKIIYAICVKTNHHPFRQISFLC